MVVLSRNRDGGAADSFPGGNIRVADVSDIYVENIRRLQMEFVQSSASGRHVRDTNDRFILIRMT